ncbi:MAG: TetR/AcrR family transcriptional regulator [Bacilli bacterium]
MNNEDIQDQIIKEFAREFNIDGPRLVLSSLAASLHISKKTIYRYFESKTAIYDCILEKTSEEIHAEQRKIVNDKDLSTKEKLFRILTIKSSTESLFDVSKMYEFSKYEPEFYQRLLNAYRTNWAPFTVLIEEGKKDGTLKKDTSAPFLVSLITKGYEMLYEGDFLTRNQLTYTEAVTKIAETVLGGIYAD